MLRLTISVNRQLAVSFDQLIERKGYRNRSEAFRDLLRRALQQEALAIEAWETRVLVGKHPDDPERLKSAPMPQEIIDKFMHG